MRWIRTILATLAVATLLIPTADASTFLHMSDIDLVQGTEIVVEGQVFDQTPFQREDGVIVTDSVIRVREVVIGDEVPKFITVRTIGGQIGDTVVEATGFPTFGRDEHLVLFLHQHPMDGSLRVLGYQQGHFLVQESPDGPPVAIPALDGGARFVTPGGQAPPKPEPEALSAFKERIRQTARDLGRNDIPAGEGR